MLKTLKNKSTKTKTIYFRMIDFIKSKLWYYALVIIVVLSIYGIAGKWIEGMSFIIAHTAVRLCFDKQWHSSNKIICFIVTIGVSIIGIKLSFGISTSLISPVAVALLVNFIGSLVKEGKVARKECKETKEELDEIKNRNIYNMSESEFVEYSRLRGLTENEIKLAYLIMQGVKGKELYKQMAYSERQCKRQRASLNKKLGLKL